MTKHGEEYNEITSLDVGNAVVEDTFNTLLSGNKPRVVFSEGSLNKGDTVLFKAHTTFMPYNKKDTAYGKNEAQHHRWIPGYGAAHSTWKAGGGACPKGHPLSWIKTSNRYRCNLCGKTKEGDRDGMGPWRCDEDKRWGKGGGCDYDVCQVCRPKKNIHLEEGEFANKKQDTVDRLEEVISAWAVFSPEKKVDRNVTFETLGGGLGEDYIKFKVDTGESKHGDSKDTVVIMAFGQ